MARNGQHGALSRAHATGRKDVGWARRARAPIALLTWTCFVAATLLPYRPARADGGAEESPRAMTTRRLEVDPRQFESLAEPASDRTMPAEPTSSGVRLDPGVAKWRADEAAGLLAADAPTLSPE